MPTLGWENADHPPNKATAQLAEKLIKGVLKELPGKRNNDVASAMMYVCARILAGCAHESRQEQAAMYRAASSYFAAMADQMFDA